jgi:hypothetical protein
MTMRRQEPEPPPENVVPFRKRPKAHPKPNLAPVDDADDDRGRDRANVAVLALAAALVFLGWLLVHELGKSSRMQDCLASGRTNCTPIETPARD